MCDWIHLVDRLRGHRKINSDLDIGKIHSSYRLHRSRENKRCLLSVTLKNSSSSSVQKTSKHQQEPANPGLTSLQHLTFTNPGLTLLQPQLNCAAFSCQTFCQSTEINKLEACQIGRERWNLFRSGCHLWRSGNCISPLIDRNMSIVDGSPPCTYLCIMTLMCCIFT